MSAPAGQSVNHLVRRIGLGSGIAVVVGSTIGSGIFKSPSGIATKLPGPLPMLLIWVIGGLFVLCGALTLGEIGGAFPYSGGLYVYVREAYGRLTAFLFGWAQLVLLRPSSIGAVAIVCAQYALKLSGLQEGKPGFNEWTAAIAILAVAVVTVANVLGVKVGTSIQNLTTLAKTGGLLALIVLACVLRLPHASAHFTPAMPSGSFTVPMFGLALVSVLWAYDGWADGSYVGGEMINPRKNVPRAIILGTLGVIGIYLLANLAYLSVFSVTEIANSQVIAADTMSNLVGKWGVTFIVATVVISTFGTLNGTMLTSPRIFFAMSEDKLFFEPLARIHPRYNTPYISVILAGVLGTIYILAATIFSGSKAFGSLTDAFVIGIVPFYALSVGAVFVFRKREKQRLSTMTPSEIEDSMIDPIEAGHPETHPHPYRPSFRTPLFPITPIIFILSTIFLLANSLTDHDSMIPTIITLGLVLVGIPVYKLTLYIKASQGS